MDATDELINDQMERVRTLFWDRENARMEYRAARREPRETKQVKRARSKALIASLDEELRKEYVALRDMLNAALGDES